MANFNNIKHEIDQNVNTNGVQAITGAILNETLKDMIDEVDEKKQDTLVAGQNITIQGNVISATGGGSGETYTAGDGINISSGNVISVDPYDLDGNGLFVDAEGDLSVNPSDIAGTGLTDEGGGHLAVNTSVIQEKLTPGSSINIDSNNKIDIDSAAIAGTGLIGTLSYGTNPILEIDPALAGDGLSWNSSGAFDVDTTTIQPKLTAGSGISISAQNVISATGGGGGGTTYGDGDAIHIDSNDNINVLYGSGLQLDGNGNLEVDSSAFSGYYLPLEGGTLQDQSNTDTLLEIQSPNGSAEVEIVASEAASPDSTAYVEVRDTNGATIYGSDGITLGGVGGDKLNFPSGPGTLATDSDLSVYLRSDASGQMQNFLDGTGDTELKIVDGFDEDYVKLGAYDTPGEAPHIEIFENGSGDTKFFYDHLERGSQVSIDYPSSSGTIALTDDIPSAGPGLGISAGNEIYVDTTQIQEKLTAGANIQINGSTISATDTNTTYSAGSGLNLNGTTFSVDTSTIQEKLTAGQNITISGNVISATGGSGATYSAGNGINIDQNNEISVDASDLAGSGLMVDQNGALAVIGGGGSGLWTSGTGTNSLMTPAAAAGTATASGTGAISMGNASQASGNYSIASGSATASGDHAIALGAGTANGYYSVMLGTMTTQGVGDQSVALNAKAANAHYSIAGPQADASGVNTTVGNVAFGYDATASPQSYTTAIGHGARAQYEGTTAIGNFNEYYGQNSGSASLFAIGNGTSDNARSNALEIRKSDNAVYIDGIGAYSGDSRTPGVKSLQAVLAGKQDLLTAGSGISIQNNVISATGGGGGTSFTPGNALELDANDNLNVLYGSGLTLNGNNELEVDPTSITGFLPLDGGTLQADPLVPATDTVLDIVSPQGISNISIDSGDNGDPNDPQGTATISMNDSNGYIQIKPDGVSDGTYTAMWPSLSQDETLATTSDVPDINSSNSLYYRNGNIPEVVDTLNLYALQCQDLSGASQTAICSVAPTSSASACLFAEDEIDQYDQPTGNGIAKVNLFDTSGDIIVGTDGILDNNTGYKLRFPTLSQDDTIATLSDIQGGGGSYSAGSGINISNNTISVDNTIATVSDLGGYLPLTGGTLREDLNDSTSTELLIQSPETYATADLTTVDLDPGNTPESLAKLTLSDYDSSSNPHTAIYETTGISNGTYKISFPTLSGNDTFALLSDVQGGGSSYSAGTGINIDANNVISNSKPGLWISGTGTNSLISPASVNYGNANGNYSVAAGTDSKATGASSFVIGGQCQGIGNNSFAGGSSSSAAGNISFAFGQSCNARNASCVALGSYCGTHSSATYAIAIGNNSQANASNSYSIGTGSATSNVGEMSLGYFPKTTGSGTDADKTHFIVGNGTGDNAKSNVLEIKKNNDAYLVGIGGFTGTNASSASTLQAVINGKQDVLTAGSGISISGNVISATGGGGTTYSAGTGLSLNGTTFSVDTTTIQEKLTAGSGITISGNTISATGGGGGSCLWSSSTGTNSLISPGAASGVSSDAAGTGAITVGYDATADGAYAFAQGGASVASGDYSFAANNGTAEGDYSAAFSGSGAYGDNSFAAGGGSNAGPDNSVALGGGIVVFDDETDPQNPINAQFGVAIGEGSIVNGEYGTAIGAGVVEASGNGSVAIGSGSTAAGLYDVAVAGGNSRGNYSFAASSGQTDSQGHYSSALSGGYATGESSLASGQDTNAFGYSSIALGLGVNTYDQTDGSDRLDTNAGEVALGRYNFSESGIIFSIGCGYYDTEGDQEVRENSVAIDTDGKIYLKGLGGYTGQGVAGCTDLVSFLNNL